MDDLISRQAAIDIAKELTITIEGYEMHNQAVMNYCAEIIQLPPIQPEIVRCKDCKHRYVEGDNVRYNTCELNHNNVQSDDWYCADAERREVTT